MIQRSNDGSFVVWLACAALLMQHGCADSRLRSSRPPEQRVGDDSDAGLPYANWPDPLAAMPHGMEQNARLCERPGQDVVRDLFCSGRVPLPTGLGELQAALGAGSDDVTGVVASASASAGLSSLSATGHSTGLGTRSVSAINPRVIAIRVSLNPFQSVAVAFTRGEQFAEIVASSGVSDVRFYLVGFRQACNAGKRGCTPGDLLTPAIESDWTEVSVYDESDLTNTVLDCAPCHQPAGPGTPKLLRMQELDRPWTHWFWQKSEGGRALLADYSAAKGDEALAGMTAAQIDGATPEAVSTLVGLINPTQPNEFESQRIEAEVKESSAALGGQQPDDNSIPGDSRTWRMAYERAQQGGALSVPYHDVKISDPAKLAAMTAAYQAFRAGDLTADELPDIRDILPDDPQRIAALGIGTEPGIDGRAVLVQACSLCHNARLDPSLSRARFRADLEGIGRAERDIAIARLSLPPSDPAAMPPSRLRLLTDEARSRAIAALRK